MDHPVVGNIKVAFSPLHSAKGQMFLRDALGFDLMEVKDKFIGPTNKSAREGFNSYNIGLRKDVNPYLLNSIEYNNWLFGWTDAKDESERSSLILVGK